MSTYMKRDKFNGILAEARTHGTKGRDLLQVLILDGMELFKMHGDTSRLNKVMELCREVKAWPVKVVHTYIIEHCDVRWKKTTDTYVKEGEGKVSAPAVPWFEYKNSINPGLFDLDKQLKSLISKAIKAKKEGKLKGDDSGHGASKIMALARLEGYDLPEGWDKADNEEKGEPAKSAASVTA